MEYAVKEEQLEQRESKLMPCKICEKEISRTAKLCPYCGESYEHVENPLQANMEIEEVDNVGKYIKFVVGGIVYLFIVVVGLASLAGVFKRIWNW